MTTELHYYCIATLSWLESFSTKLLNICSFWRTVINVINETKSLNLELPGPCVLGHLCFWRWRFSRFFKNVLGKTGDEFLEPIWWNENIYSIMKKGKKLYFKSNLMKSYRKIKQQSGKKLTIFLLVGYNRTVDGQESKSKEKQELHLQKSQLETAIDLKCSSSNQCSGLYPASSQSSLNSSVAKSNKTEWKSCTNRCMNVLGSNWSKCVKLDCTWFA